jgi:hypothetical protein
MTAKVRTVRIFLAFKDETIIRSIRRILDVIKLDDPEICLEDYPHMADLIFFAETMEVDRSCLPSKRYVWFVSSTTFESSWRPEKVTKIHILPEHNGSIYEDILEVINQVRHT